MKKLILLTTLLIPACADPAPCPPPIDVGQKLVLPSDHRLVVPPQGIRFSNGFTIGGYCREQAAQNP